MFARGVVRENGGWKLWANSFWHHLVHQRLGETLHYFFLHLQPFEPARIASSLDVLLTERELGDVHCYKIFGRYDVLVRAWLHPNIVHAFPGWLRDCLRNCTIVRQFDVSTIDHAWYDSPGDNPRDRSDLLKNLTEENIRAAQEGDVSASVLLQRLSQANLFLENHDTKSPSSIKFFVAVEIDRSQRGREEEVASAIASYVRREGKLFNEAVYHGHGECDILLKAQSDDFFAISRLPNWIGESFRGVRTETYFSHDVHHMTGSGKIGRSTFDEIRGRDLFAQSIVPELYDGSIITNPICREEIENFLRKEAAAIGMDNRLRVFVREYAMGYLLDSKTDMLKVLFEFFTDIENYLRQGRDAFGGRLLGSDKIASIVEKAGGDSDPKARKYPSLGSLFFVYSEILKGVQADSSEILDAKWENLVQLRNLMAHGALDPGEDWAGTVRMIMEYHPRLVSLFHQVGRTTGRVFKGRFL